MMTGAPNLRVLWLVRHGETTWNCMGWVQGHADGARLTRKGRHQVHRVGSLLARRDIGAVYSSDLRRASDSAAIIADLVDSDVRTDQRLRERSFGETEGSASSMLVPSVTGIDHGRITDPRCRAKGGESLEEVALRSLAFLVSLRAEGDRPDDHGDVVVVAHGGSIRMLQAVAAGHDLHGMAWGSVPNASLYRLMLPTALPRPNADNAA